MEFHTLPLCFPGTPELDALFAQASLAQQAGQPKQNPFDPIDSFDSYRAYELGFHHRMCSNDHLALHKMAYKFQKTRQRRTLSPASSARLKVINELLLDSPWTVMPSLGLVFKSHITDMASKIASGVFDRCNHQVRKGNPLSNLNLDAIVFHVLHEITLTSPPTVTPDRCPETSDLQT